MITTTTLCCPIFITSAD